MPRTGSTGAWWASTRRPAVPTSTPSPAGRLSGHRKKVNPSAPPPRLRRRRIKHTIPEPKGQRANRRRRGSRGGRPVGFDKERYKRRNEVERTINRLKSFRAVAPRFDKRAYVFHGTVTVAAIRLWLRA